MKREKGCNAEIWSCLVLFFKYATLGVSKIIDVAEEGEVGTPFIPLQIQRTVSDRARN